MNHQHTKENSATNVRSWMYSIFSFTGHWWKKSP